MLLNKLLNIDYAAVEERLKGFLTEYLEASGAKGYVIGLSGGVDSSTTAALAVRAVGSRRVVG
ncbi:MAG TPA: NAD(+) synthetase, partial [Thermofilaceae archaeon]|nr:NAD(+) synthetase [Thermofilaceae archaeon]